MKKLTLTERQIKALANVIGLPGTVRAMGTRFPVSGDEFLSHEEMFDLARRFDYYVNPPIEHEVEVIPQ